jgi:MoxR-like ATPase
MVNSVLTAKLDFWVKHNKNVLFIGKHGVGKTAMVKDTFDRHKLNWRYFSASTMDPWVDFIGVPREKTEDKIPEQFEIIRELASIDTNLAYEWVQSNWKMNEQSARSIVSHALNRKQGLTYLDLVRPQTFAAGEVEALFFDEYNRSQKKVRNAVMELIQFKSINGMKFPNLRIVWAAINPDDDEDQTYDVERLDPAQADRYHVAVEVPYKPNSDWFRQKYGQRTADAAIHWWEELPEEEKNRISPRRLQYALDVYQERGDIRDVLPFTANISKLTISLNTGPVTEKLENLMTSKDVVEARGFLANENNYEAAMKYIPKSEKLTEYFIPLLPKEKMMALMNDDDKICNYIINNSDKIPVFRDVCKQTLNAGTNQRLTKKIRRTLTENQNLATAFANSQDIETPDEPYHANSALAWPSVIENLKNMPQNGAQQKIVVYDTIVKNIPQNQTSKESLDTLEILNKIFSGSFASSITAKPFDKLVGVVNNCIVSIHKETGYGLTEIIKTHGSHFKELLEKIQAAGLTNRLGISKK